MKYGIIFFLLFTFFATGTKAQHTAEQKVIIEHQCREKLDRLMSLVEKKHYEGFGKMMAYTGRDPNRAMQDKLNLWDPHEKLFAELSLNELAHHLDKSALWHADNFRIVKGLESDMYIFDMEFTYLKGKTKQYKMTFMKLKDDILFCHAEK